MTCKKCGAKLGGSYSGVTEGNELVIVDRQTQEALALNKYDKLCNDCSAKVDFYRRIK